MCIRDRCNASGFIPGEKGATRYWVKELEFLLPNGDLIEVKRDQYISENGNFSIAAFLVLDRGIPREENEVFYENNVIGKITSGTHSPTLKSSIAIGLIKRDFNIVNNKVRIKVRDKFLEAEIRKLPMYRRRRK